MVALVAMAVMLPRCVWAQDSAKATTEKPKVVGVLFYADWCASCNVLDPKLDEGKSSSWISRSTSRAWT